MRKTEQQENQLLDALEQHGRLSIAEVVSLLKVSESTARRIIVRLEQKGAALRTFGGIQKPVPYQNTYSYTELEQKMTEEKKCIGQFAGTLVQDRDILFISGGTTVLQMAVSLAQRLKENELHDVTVVTSSFVNVEVLAGRCKVLLIGGEYRPERRDFAGFLAEKMIRSVSLNKCFLGVDGINISDGLMSYDEDTSRIDETVISRSAHTTVLCDSTKFQRTGFVLLAPIQRAHAIVTDAAILPGTKSAFESAGLKVHTV